MAKLQYIGLSHFREISKKDFKDNDIDHDGVKFSRQDLLRSQNPKKVPNVVEVTDEVAEFLLEVEPKDWKIVKDDEEPQAAGDPDAQEVSNPQPSDPENTPSVADNPALGETQTEAGTTTATGGSSTTPSARGGRR